MSSIRIRKHIESDTLTLPELRPFIGRTVEIAIEDSNSTTPSVVPGTGDWDAVLAGCRQLTDYDYQAQIDQDARDIQDLRELQEHMK